MALCVKTSRQSSVDTLCRNQTDVSPINSFFDFLSDPDPFIHSHLIQSFQTMLNLSSIQPKFLSIFLALITCHDVDARSAISDSSNDSNGGLLATSLLISFMVIVGIIISVANAYFCRGSKKKPALEPAAVQLTQPTAFAQSQTQYTQPQYAQTQYAQPQYAQTQYTQPQYAAQPQQLVKSKSSSNAIFDTTV